MVTAQTSLVHGPDLHALLESTSRTFALAIPLLDAPTRTEVMIAYLMFRIVDTFEDSTTWSRELRLAALADFAGLVREPDDTRVRCLASRWTASPPADHRGYNDLVTRTPAVIAAFAALPPGVRGIVTRHTLRTISGMAAIVGAGDGDGRVTLSSVAELRHYCYLVAGIVGELLTELFIHDAPQLAPVADTLHATEIRFGEALQLVNILRDSSDDAADGRRYLPPGSRAEVLALAREDVAEASRYVDALARGGAPRGMVAFTAFTLLLARATLNRLTVDGPGAKVGRDEVRRVLRHVETAPAAAMLIEPA